MLFKANHSPIGVALGAAAVRAVQLRRAAHGWAVLDTVELARLNPDAPFDAAEAQRLAAVLRRRAFVGTEVVVSLPNAELIRGLVEVPSQDGGDPFMAAARDVERTHNLQPGGYELAAWLPPASGTRRHAAVCVTGCTHESAEALLDAFDAADLDVAALDSRACALSRVVDTAEDAGTHLTAVLDVEHDSAELVLLHRGAVAYQRPLIDAGLNQIHQRLAEHGLGRAAAEHCLKQVGLADAGGTEKPRVREALSAYTQSLVNETRPALDYAARVYSDLPIERFVLAGAGADVPVLGYELRQQLRLEPAEAQPADIDTNGQPVHAVALGLALHPQEVSWAAA